MTSTSMSALPDAPPAGGIASRAGNLLLRLFLRMGVLPFLLVAAIVVFSLLSDQFLTAQNLTNLLRQSVYLVLVSLGQMLALVTGGFDLSVGTIIALTSVTSALAMTGLGPEVEPLVAIAIGCLAGLGSALLVGLVNGAGIAYIGVSPFIMTLGMQSIGFGLALYLTGGVPVSGLPAEFGDTLGFGSLLGVPSPVLITVVVGIAMFVLMERTARGNHLLAVGGNAKAASLSGIDTRRTLLLAYLGSALLASVAGLLLTARVGSGEANLGGSVALESIAACVIAGVSLRGGIGRVENVLLGAIFITQAQNGMNLANVGAYLQMLVLGALLIFAVVADQLRHRLSSQG